ncbi:helix-turn-helix domain-containing protein [Rufibacter quisquiliarum]|uniref:Transcriptional regulator with XRE-family HTH domain n=1 Tax=Rufibacter quisquiliarum TaxID=1549639 RepID=A0A839GV06_9BACT|nr:helix-turn-helix transcriptional regulator [Rufibacter quisquiliarum]MBA9078258.1 transcriptional regulator with XRE-family HTH domain [Rufibacter quisquiliarum]
MRSKVAERILAKTPEDVRIFTRLYADLVVLINTILEEKGYTQKTLAEKLEKRPSEINKWLNGEHNFTLRSVAKLQAELGEVLLQVPSRKTAAEQFNTSLRIFHQTTLQEKLPHKSEREKLVQNDFVWTYETSQKKIKNANQSPVLA